MKQASHKPVVLIIHPGTLGDVVLSLIAIQGIRRRFSDHESVLLVRGEVGRVLHEYEVVDRVLDMDGRMLSELLGNNPQLAPEAANVLFRCRHAVVWVNDQGGQLSANLKMFGVEGCCIISPHDESLLASHQADRYCETLEFFGQDIQGNGFSQSFQFKSNEPLLKFGSSDIPAGHDQEVLMIHQGSGSRHKCVQPERMGALIQRLTNRRHSKVILCQGPADAEMVSELQPYLHQAPHEILKDTDLLEIAEVLRKADLFVGHDSGLTHLAAALGVPTLAIFGPTDPQRWGPKGANVEILQGPCCQCQDWNAVQQCSDKICLTHSIDDIVEAVERLLASSSNNAHSMDMVKNH